MTVFSSIVSILGHPSIIVITRNKLKIIVISIIVTSTTRIAFLTCLNLLLSILNLYSPKVFPEKSHVQLIENI